MLTTEELVEKIKAEAPKITLHNEELGISTQRWVVEGDLALSEERLLPYAAERVDLARRAQEDPEVQKRGLVAIEKDGKILRWSRGKVLDYCVRRGSFGSEDEYRAVVRDMRFATADWSALCGVSFFHREELDHAPTFRAGDVVFPVLRQAGGGNTVAVAFFPDDPPADRLVVCFDGYFRSGPGAFDPVGVLRHELGHVLGFRHEHIRPEAADLFHPEDTEHIHLLTDYDPTSVMHYIGHGVGDPQLRFTAADRAGAVQVYGQPDSEFTFVE